MATSDLLYSLQMCATAGVGLTLSAEQVQRLNARVVELEADEYRLDMMEGMGAATGLPWIFRDSTTGRGLRLHQSSSRWEGEFRPTIREAIDAGIKVIGR